MKVAIVKERKKNEKRVAASPETVKKMVGMGLEVRIEKDAGLAAAIRDEEYIKAGAIIEKNYRDCVKDASLVLKVQRPLSKDESEVDEISLLPSGATLIGLLSPYTAPFSLNFYVERQVTALSLELIPRITRAQSMDVLSSQSNLAGYRAVIEAANLFGCAFPMMMTAAGTIPPTRVLILGAGVAGLQAIATAKRLGAIVSAFDVRAAAKEQVESLGASFITIESEELGEGTGGYAKEMSEAYQKRQADKIHETVQKNDIVITTALIPGKPAPRLITHSMIKDMKEGSILVDLAVEAGGNIEGSVLNQVVEKEGVKICGYENMPSRIARNASALYARNMLNFLMLLHSSNDQTLNINFEDEIIKSTALTHAGQIVHSHFKA